VSGCDYQLSIARSGKFTTTTVTAQGSDRCTIAVAGGVFVTVDYGIVDTGSGPIGAVMERMTIGREVFEEVAAATVISHASCQGKIKTTADQRRCARLY
jgi:hypothetical protein